MLELQNVSYKSGEGYLSRYTANNYCNRVLKKEYPFLREVDKFALTNCIWSLDDAFRGFFDHRTSYPRFKSRESSRKSYKTNYSNNNIEISSNAIKLPKLGWVTASVHRFATKECKLKSATVRQIPSGEYYCIVHFEMPEVTHTNELNPEKAIGLDYKMDGLYVSSEGTVCGSPLYYRQSEEMLARAQRKLARKQKGGKNYIKQKRKVAKLMHHIANQRNDFAHKQSHALVEKWDYVCAENLDLKEMATRAGKKTMDNGYNTFLAMVEYKMEERGKQFIKVDKYYPSSQICSSCGFKNAAAKDLTLREWTCPQCGKTHDRDVNAAINIREEGLRTCERKNGLQSA